MGLMVQEQEQAPDFTVKTDEGKDLKLSALRGKPVVLYFYPKDDTPGCTTEACELRDAFPRFKKSEATILGVSPDDVASHQKFKKKFELPFTLLADTDHKIAERYGVWVEKSMYGKKYWGVQRATFIIDPKGTVAKVFPKVKPEGHASEVEGEIGKLRGGR
jgi:thioredoxin-dependent peroxiredoxin